MLVPFGIFWVMVFLTRRELGAKGIAACLPLGVAFLAAFLLTDVLWIYAVVGQVLLDVILVLILFGGDIRIN